MRWSIGLLVSMGTGIALAAAFGCTLWTTPDPAPALSPVVQPVRTQPTTLVQSPQRTPHPVNLTQGARDSLKDAQLRAAWSGGATVTCDVSDLLDDGAVTLDPSRGPLNNAVIDADFFFTSVTDGRLSFVTNDPSGEVVVRSQRLEEGSIARIRWTGGLPGSTVSCDATWRTAAADHYVSIRIIEEDGSPEDPAQGLTFVQGCGMFLDATAIIGRYVPVERARCALQVQRRHPDLPLIMNRGDVVWLDPMAQNVTEVVLVAPEGPRVWQVPNVQELVVVGDLAAYHGLDKAADLVASVGADLVAGRWDPLEALDLLATWSGEGLDSEDPRHVHRLSQLVDKGDIKLADVRSFDPKLGRAVAVALSEADALADGR